MERYGEPRQKYLMERRKLYVMDLIIKKQIQHLDLKNKKKTWT